MKVYTSAVVIIPPEGKWAPIQEIRKLYDRQINRWMPHITLLYPFRPKNEYNRLEDKFSEKCKQIKASEIYLNKFNYFYHGKGRYTIWLDPEPNEFIINIQAELLKIVPDCNDLNKFKNNFRPHLSVAQVIGKKKLNDIIIDLQKNWNDIKFLLDQVYFISRGDNKSSKFEIIKHIFLQE